VARAGISGPQADISPLWQPHVAVPVPFGVMPTDPESLTGTTLNRYTGVLQSLLLFHPTI